MDVPVSKAALKMVLMNVELDITDWRRPTEKTKILLTAYVCAYIFQEVAAAMLGGGLQRRVHKSRLRIFCTII